MLQAEQRPHLLPEHFPQCGGAVTTCNFMSQESQTGRKRQKNEFKKEAPRTLILFHMVVFIIDNATECINYQLLLIMQSFKKKFVYTVSARLHLFSYYHWPPISNLTSGKMLLLKSKYKNYNFLTQLFPNDTPVYKTNKSCLMSAHKHTYTADLWARLSELTT